VSDLVDLAVELMDGLGDVRARRMFGGHGIFHGDIMFALVVDDVLYLKANNASRDEFVSRGLHTFTYTSRGKTVSLQYYETPAEAWDDAAEMLKWARLALDAARPAAAARRPRARSSGSASGKRKR
jgi:DNA transformation protein